MQTYLPHFIPKPNPEASPTFVPPSAFKLAGDISRIRKWWARAVEEDNLPSILEATKANVDES